MELVPGNDTVLSLGTHPTPIVHRFVVPKGQGGDEDGLRDGREYTGQWELIAGIWELLRHAGLQRVIPGCRLRKGSLLVILCRWHFLINLHTNPTCPPLVPEDKRMQNLALY